MLLTNLFEIVVLIIVFIGRMINKYGDALLKH